MPLLAGANNENAIWAQQLPPEPVIFGQTPAMRDVRQKLERVAGANLSVLISGESGTGKDIIARLLHLYSPWSNGPFVKVNCPAIPGTLLESELFGYERGAFTGASNPKPGRVEMAHRGGSPDMGEDGRLYNTAFLLGTDGQIHGRYDKRHLVPFGEYVPLQQVFFFLDKLVVGIGDFGRGRRATVFSLDGVRFSVMICYEAIFPGEVREFGRDGAEFLVNITNDAWFGRSGAPSQHLAMAAMRAVENGMYLVRAANTGISAVVAPTGEILAETGIFTEATLLGTIHPRLRETPYTRYGDMLAWVCLTFLVAYGVALARARWMLGAENMSPTERRRSES